MTKKKILGWCACGAAAVALLSFFMNYLSEYGMGISGFQMMGEVKETGEGMLMVIALVATIATLVAALLSNFNDGNYSMAIYCSIASVICMWLAYFTLGELVGENLVAYAGSGFWTFMIAHVTATVLGFEAGIPNID